MPSALYRSLRICAACRRLESVQRMQNQHSSWIVCVARGGMIENIKKAAQK